MHDFKQSLAKGEEAEKLVLHWLEKHRQVRPATREEQRQGIDLLVTTAVEVKLDTRWQETGNAFIETVSVDTSGKAGWAETSQADVLLYILYPEEVLQIGLSRLRAVLDRWKARYRQARASNAGYDTLGLIVPVEELRKVADKITPYQRLVSETRTE